MHHCPPAGRLGHDDQSWCATMAGLACERHARRPSREPVLLESDPSRSDCPGRGTDLLSSYRAPDGRDDWIISAPDRHRRQRPHALDELCRGPRARAVRCSRSTRLSAVAREPWRASSHKAVMEVHLAEGNVTAARRQLESYRRELDDAGPDDVGVDDLGALLETDRWQVTRQCTNQMPAHTTRRLHVELTRSRQTSSTRRSEIGLRGDASEHRPRRQRAHDRARSDEHDTPPERSADCRPRQCLGGRTRLTDRGALPSEERCI